MPFIGTGGSLLSPFSEGIKFAAWFWKGKRGKVGRVFGRQRFSFCGDSVFFKTTHFAKATLTSKCFWDRRRLLPRACLFKNPVRRRERRKFSLLGEIFYYYNKIVKHF